MPKFSKYELQLICRSERNDFQPDSFDTIVADDLVSLLSQLIMLVANLHRRELQEASRVDDDIPF